MVCPARSGAAAVIRAVALMIPGPHIPAVEHEFALPSEGNGVEVLARSAKTSLSSRVGSTERSSERTPATCGVAIEVPWYAPYDWVDGLFVPLLSVE